MNQDVLVADYSNPNYKQWGEAIACKKIGLQTYLCQLRKSGRVIKRHIDQIKRIYRNS
jgi:hypothetical protein